MFVHQPKASWAIIVKIGFDLLHLSIVDLLKILGKLMVILVNEKSKQVRVVGCLDSRLVAQSGLFVVPGVLDQPLDVILENYGGSDGRLIKFVLPLSMRDDAMRALYRMNVTYATLFPDLDGLARSVSYELEAIWERLVEDYERAHPGEPPAGLPLPPGAPDA